MNQVFPDVSLPKWLRLMTASNLVFRLYSNDWTPGLDTTLADLTQVVASASASSVYGYYVTNGAGDLMLACRFDDAPVELESSVGYLPITVGSGSWSDPVVLLHNGIITGLELNFPMTPQIDLQTILGDKSRFSS